jgi:leucyl-tRNA synthetase
MTPYNFQAIEQKWQQYWEDQQTYRAVANPHKPKYYVLDMFPYPSGEGLHVGHPLGYIATDIIARYKRSKGYEVLHPMGFDAFGLPAEQYAIQTGQHPAITTAKNTQRYQQQLRQLGLSYDWDRAIITSDPSYYKWTQWIFIQLFNSWYDTQLQQARPIQELVTIFEQQGNQHVQASCDNEAVFFTAQQWQAMDKADQQRHLLSYRLAFLENTMVNWCPELGTVLANEEVKDGLSERGGYPVIRQQMKQWSLRITAYADRLLAGLDHLNWPASTKEMQRNWIGKSVGAAINFITEVNDQQHTITVFTTRPDTIFGVTFIALSPEHPLATAICTPAQKASLEHYIATAINRSERDRLTAVNKVTGAFTGAYALHPLSQKPIPIWVSDYVLAGYGTGAVMGVPAHDSRDYAFAKQFQLPIIQVITGGNIHQAAHEAQEGSLINSDFLNGLSVQAATQQIINKLEALQIGKSKVTYRLRNAIFSRQRYWGEPFPIYYQDGLPYALSEKELPLELPTLTNYKPTATGQPPLGNASNWKTKEGHPLELNTMPGWAGSSWYFFRYMDPHNTQQFVSPAAQAYWQAVDLYVGGSEHTTGHLLYARFWTKFLYDLGYINVEEPFQQLIHQGMIQSRSSLVYRIKGTNQFVSHNLRQQYETTSMHIAIDLVDKDNVLHIEAFKKWRPDLQDATFILEDGQYICGSEVEKMSKSKHNTITPDQVVAQYGADTLRLYLMFLGPIDQAKPWDMHGIEGIFRFLLKVWRLFHSAHFASETPNPAAQKVIHQTIKKISEDIERFSFNTAVSNLMICVNKLTALQCTNRQVLQQLVLLLAPFAPHLAEELWQLLGHTSSVTQEPFPTYEEAYLQEENYEYPVAINGKVRAKINFSWSMSRQEIEAAVRAHEAIQKWIQEKPIQKMIIVPHQMINVVV